MSTAVRERALVGVADKVPETCGSGVIFRRGATMRRLRVQPPGGKTVVFELHERQISPSWLGQQNERRGPLREAPSFAGSSPRALGWSPRARPDWPQSPGWSLRGPGVPVAPSSALTPRPGASGASRMAGTSVADEWKSLGFNCGGAVLAWVGVAGTGAAAPVTGGLSFGASLVLYGGAIAASGQCVASVYRIHNAIHGRAAVNDALDANSYYRWTMRGADAVGLLGAGAALNEARVAGKALRAAGTGWSQAVQRTTTSAQRVRVAAGLELPITRIGSKVLSRLARQKLLDSAAAVLGIYASYDGGVIRELIVWIAEERA